jgi:hypothetical protein
LKRPGLSVTRCARCSLRCLLRASWLLPHRLHSEAGASRFHATRSPLRRVAPRPHRSYVIHRSLQVWKRAWGSRDRWMRVWCWVPVQLQRMGAQWQPFSLHSRVVGKECSDSWHLRNRARRHLRAARGDRRSDRGAHLEESTWRRRWAARLLIDRMTSSGHGWSQRSRIPVGGGTGCCVRQPAVSFEGASRACGRLNTTAAAAVAMGSLLGWIARRAAVRFNVASTHVDGAHQRRMLGSLRCGGRRCDCDHTTCVLLRICRSAYLLGGCGLLLCPNVRRDVTCECRFENFSGR